MRPPHSFTTSTRRLLGGLAVAVSLPLVLAPPAQSADTTGTAATPGLPPIGSRTLVPIGGGYGEQVERQFAGLAQQRATRLGVDRTVDLLVVPSTYGDDPADRAENLRLARGRADQLNAACAAAVGSGTVTGCTARLLTLLDRADAESPANSAALAGPGVDGVFILGGDQTVAMRVLANTPAEAALAAAYRRGVVTGGSSAGNAVLSRSMITGYTPDGYPWTGLQRGSATIGWGDALGTDDRGLSFGSQRFLFDQHFYQRGRFGRLLNLTAQSVERYGSPGKLGLGVDYNTAPVLADDRVITGMIGDSSAALIDLAGSGAPRWVGPRQTLSVRGVRTHLLAPGTGQTFDAATRQLRIGGTPLPTVTAPPPVRLALPGRATVLLGGGGNDTAESAVLQRFTSKAGAGGPGELVIIAAGYPDPAAARAAAQSYTAAVRQAGWTSPVRVLIQGTDRVDATTVAGASGVLVLGGDQQYLSDAVRDSGFAGAVRAGVTGARVVLTEGAATAVLGPRYDAVADPTADTDEDAAIAAFRADGNTFTPGLGLIRSATLEPVLGYDYRWGRLYAAAAHDPATPAIGISEQTAIEVAGTTATVLGARSVVTVDGRRGWFGTGSNGALAAGNVFLSALTAGERVAGG